MAETDNTELVERLREALGKILDCGNLSAMNIARRALNRSNDDAE